MRTHYRDGGPSVELYDLRIAPDRLEPLRGDVDFYREFARKLGGPVLELGCGTGRVAIPLARDGREVVGLDLSPHMLRLARSKAEGLPNIRFVRGDMSRFDLGRKFRLIVVPFRAFQHLMTPKAQRSCLEAVRRHLEPRGRFLVQLFVPRLEYCLEQAAQAPASRDEVVDPRTGDRWTLSVANRRNDALRQTMRETWIWTRRDSAGREVQRTEDELSLRWTFVDEMRHLLELSGLEPVACYGNFQKGPVTSRSEQIWVTKRA